MDRNLLPHASTVLFASARQAADLLGDVPLAVLAPVLDDPMGDGADVLIVFHDAIIDA
ncbi:MAG: hypothetical protein ABWZ74_09740 [Hyphomicrobiaceae bacterium]